MIFKLKQWCEGIIIAIIISVIIEMLVPDIKSKKYVKVIIGIYIMFVSLNPILEMLNYDFNFSKILETNTIETSSQNYNEKIKNVYILGIEEKIKEDIENLGYIVEDVSIATDSNYEKIEKISFKIKSKKNVNNNIAEVQKITIGKEKKDYDDIVSFLKTNYLVEEEQILIR